MDTKNYLKEQYADADPFLARAYLGARFSTNPQGWTNWLFEQIHFPPNASVLELGCGPAFLWQNPDRLPQDAEIFLTDFSEGMLAEAKNRLGEQAGRFHFDVVDAEEIPYRNNQFDIVIANHMLYHIPDLPKALGEIARVLKPDGVLYASTIGKNNLKELTGLFRDCFSVPERPRRTVADAFGLENGGDQLKAFFGSVERKPYENSLLATEAGLLIGYILSAGGRVSEFMTQERIQTFEAYLNGILNTKGPIHLTKESGLFTARKQ